jgi:hypothetical protein
MQNVVPGTKWYSMSAVDVSHLTKRRRNERKQAGASFPT